MSPRDDDSRECQSLHVAFVFVFSVVFSSTPGRDLISVVHIRKTGKTPRSNGYNPKTEQQVTLPGSRYHLPVPRAYIVGPSLGGLLICFADAKAIPLAGAVLRLGRHRRKECSVRSEGAKESLDELSLS